jgi:hypothetical protein
MKQTKVIWRKTNDLLINVRIIHQPHTLVVDAFSLECIAPFNSLLLTHHLAPCSG